MDLRFQVYEFLSLLVLLSSLLLVFLFSSAPIVDLWAQIKSQSHHYLENHYIYYISSLSWKEREAIASVQKLRKGIRFKAFWFFLLVGWSREYRLFLNFLEIGGIRQNLTLNYCGRYLTYQLQFYDLCSLAFIGQMPMSRSYLISFKLKKEGYWLVGDSKFPHQRTSPVYASFS